MCIKDQMSLNSTIDKSQLFNNWDNYQNQIKRYLESVSDNPYVGELADDFKETTLKNITQYYTESYSNWITKLLVNNTININSIYRINSLFNNGILMKLFCNKCMEIVSENDTKKLLNFITLENLELVKNEINDSIPKTIFKPSELKFVTTTGLGILDGNVNFVKLYELFKEPKDIVKSISTLNSTTYFNDHVINKIIGCKTGKSPIKGYFKKTDVGDFYNCATLQVVLGENKCANVKLFNNGKLQLTGIPHPDLGQKTIKIICDLINSLNTKENNFCLAKNTNIKLQSYKTVMINTCYDLGISIDRDVTSNILNKRYNFNTVWEGDGYPGVRVLYYYNENSIGTDQEGICNCNNNNTNKCSGKGCGNGINECRKISIAIFQSGKVIIAGGCQETKPIFQVYKHFNSIISDIAFEIKKVDNNNLKQVKTKTPPIFIDKRLIKNYDKYKQILKTIKSNLDNLC